MLTKVDLVNKIFNGDCLEVLKTFPDNSVDMCITSPPYWGLRNYHIDGQIGNEKSFNEYIDKLIAIFKEVKRIIKDTGACWVNLGDTYNSSGSSARPGGFQATRRKKDINGVCVKKEVSDNLGEKSLCQIPNRFSIRMTDELKFILRNEIIWYKPVCMPSSTKDRFTVDFEKLFFFTKQPNYYFETQYEPLREASLLRAKYGLNRRETPDADMCSGNIDVDTMGDRFAPKNGRIKRSVWIINPAINKQQEEHFATFPEDLIKSPILGCCSLNVCSKCGSPKFPIYKSNNPGGIFGTKGLPNVLNGECDRNLINKTGTVISTSKLEGYKICDCKEEFVPGIVLDPFMGSGTTALVAKKYKRNYVGIEINSKYIKIAENKIHNISKHEDVLMPNESNSLGDLF